MQPQPCSGYLDLAPSFLPSPPARQAGGGFRHHPLQETQLQPGATSQATGSVPPAWPVKLIQIRHDLFFERRVGRQARGLSFSGLC